jgi:hypothetical protein
LRLIVVSAPLSDDQISDVLVGSPVRDGLEEAEPAGNTALVLSDSDDQISDVLVGSPH